MSVIRRIDVWGDSILKGVVLDEAAGRYRLLKNSAVNAFAQLFHLDVKNHSHFGYTAPKALASIDKTLSSDFKADLVLLEFGGNDCDFNWAEVSENPGIEHKPNTPFDDFVAAMQKMIQTLMDRGITPVLMSLPPIDSNRFFDWVTKPDNVDPDRVLSFIGDKDYIYRHQERYSLAITGLAYRYKLPLIEVREAFLKEKNLCDCLCTDGIHPNERGQQLIQEILSKSFLMYSAV